MAEISEFGKKEEEIELDLGLAIGRSCRNLARQPLTAEESTCGESATTCSENQSSAKDLKKKRKKREIGAEEDEHKAVDRDLTGDWNSTPPCRTSPIIPYFPMTAIKGVVFPSVMPWTGPCSGAGKFNPQWVKKISDESPARSSSTVADNQSCSNGDNGIRSNSSQSLEEHESNGSINEFDHTALSRRPDDHSSGKLSVSGDRKAAGAKSGSPSLASMPCVSTTGEGPNSKRIIGFLHRYSKSEVGIVCVCHGKSFSPAEFVKHAGGRAVANPLRHITVIPSAFA